MAELTCCCCTIQNESCDTLECLQSCFREDDVSDGPYQSGCCSCLRVVALPVLFTLAVLVLLATDCDIGPTRNAAGSVLVFVVVLETICGCLQLRSMLNEMPCVITMLQTVNFLLEVAALVLLMVVSVNALTWLPSDCNHHRAQSLEVAAAASIIAMLVVQFHLAVNCKTNTRWHSCSIVVTSPDDLSHHDGPPDTVERRLLCLVCDVPEGGSILARQAGLTVRLSWFQVLLSLLGWALLLAGCLLLNSNSASPSPLVTAAGAFTVAVASVSLVGGWIGFLGETAIFVNESALGRRRLDRVVLVLTTMLLALGITALGLLLTVALETAVDVPETSNSTWVKPGIVSTEWLTVVDFTSLGDYAVREVRITAYSTLPFLLLLLLLAACNNALVCRCQNVRCHDVCSVVLADPERAPILDENRRRPRNQQEPSREVGEPSTFTDSNSTPGGSSTLCRICMSREATQACMPCGHLCCCSNCAWRASEYGCPVCREHIDDVINIYRC